MREANRRACEAVPNLFAEREKLLFQDWPMRAGCPRPRHNAWACRACCPSGTPCPSGTTLLARAWLHREALPRRARAPCTKNGLSAGHLRHRVLPREACARTHSRPRMTQGVDRIFMPIVTTVPSENTSKDQPVDVRRGEGLSHGGAKLRRPQRAAGTSPFDSPYVPLVLRTEDRDTPALLVLLARHIQHPRRMPPCVQHSTQADSAPKARSAKRLLTAAARSAVRRRAQEGTYAVVLAGRPYHNDALVNHELPTLFTELRHSRDHCRCRARRHRSADLSEQPASTSSTTSTPACLSHRHRWPAQSPEHGIRAARKLRLRPRRLPFRRDHPPHEGTLGPENALGAESSTKATSRGPLRIRVRSFIETGRTNAAQRKRPAPRRPPCLRLTPKAAPPKSPAATTVAHRAPAQAAALKVAPLAPPPSSARSTRRWLRPPARSWQTPTRRSSPRPIAATKTVLVPNTSHAFCRLMAAVVRQPGRCRPCHCPLAENAPSTWVNATFTTTSASRLKSSSARHWPHSTAGKYDPDNVAIGTGKYIGDCRLTHYAALLRKALDDAGYEQVPIITNDDRRLRTTSIPASR